MKRTLPFLRRALRITGSERSALDVARGRLVLMSITFALGFILIAARIVDLSLIQGQLGVDPAITADAGDEDNGQAADGLKARADIVDRNGILLATSLATPSLFADTTMIQNPDQIARELVDTLPGLSYNDTLQNLKRKTHFIWIKRNLTPDEQFAVLKLGHPGLQFRTEYRRIYPQGPLAAHIVGFTNVDGHGLYGLERSYDAQLSQGGAPLQTTLDIRLQYILRREALRAKTEFTAQAAAGTILDIKTGEILASVSLPDFDPHNPGDANDKTHFNMMTQGSYELGSIFKIFTAAALFEDRHVPLSRSFDASHPLKYGRFTIHDFDPEGRWLTIPEVLMYSSNIGAAQMGEMIGADNLKAFYKQLGFYQPLPLEIKEIARPHFPDPWYDINTLTAAFGHGVSVSPMSMVAAAASVVGPGTLIHPTLVMQPRDDRVKTETRVVSDDTVHKMRELMRLVVTSGTAKAADVPGYTVGGKTGTADKAENGGYDRHKKISSFLGFFPIENPHYAVYVLVDQPNGTKKTGGYATGGYVGAPAVGRVIAAMAPLVGMPPKDVPPEQDMSAPLYQYVHDSKITGPGGAHVVAASY
jgi:cell division protein FtsI (penicillin-binding protein 3)